LASIRYIVGLIESASVSQPANASTITYTISYIDEGGGIVQAPRQAPSYPRYADYNESTETGCFVNPFPAGQIVIGLMLDSRLYWLFNELPAIAGCGTTNGQLMMRDPVTGQMVPVPQPSAGVPTITVTADGQVITQMPSPTEVAQNIIAGTAPSGSTPSGSTPATNFGELQFNDPTNSMLIPLM
jgi:hypothetical protein